MNLETATALAKALLPREVMSGAVVHIDRDLDDPEAYVVTVYQPEKMRTFTLHCVGDVMGLPANALT